MNIKYLFDYSYTSAKNENVEKFGLHVIRRLMLLHSSKLWTERIVC